MEESIKLPTSDCSISELVQKAKDECLDIVALFREYFVVEEITI